MLWTMVEGLKEREREREGRRRTEAIELKVRERVTKTIELLS